MKTTLHNMRISKNLSQSQLANISGVSIRTLQDFEQGRKPLINAKGEMLYRLSASLGCSINDLLVNDISDKHINVMIDTVTDSSHLRRYTEKLCSRPLYGKYYTFPVIVPDSKVNMKRVYPMKQQLIYTLHSKLSQDSRIASIVLFGSSITMHCNKDSDTDLAVRLKMDCINNETRNDTSEIIQEICNWNADIIWYDRIDKTDRIYNEICKGVQIV